MSRAACPLRGPGICPICGPPAVAISVQVRRNATCQEWDALVSPESIANVRAMNARLGWRKYRVAPDA